MKRNSISLSVFIAFAFNVFVRLSCATILLKSMSMSFADLPAKFALRVNNTGVCGALHVANPSNACTSLRNGFLSNKNNTAFGVNFVLIVRGECDFQDKILNAQNAGFRAAIVYDSQDKGNLVYMMLNRKNISVHAVFVTKKAGEFLKEHARGKDDECCIFPFNGGATWTVLAISFISFVIILSILVVGIFTPRNWLSSRGTSNLPKNVDAKMFEALPCFTFSSARLSDCHAGETCPICLEDYKDGEVLKVLPCRHEFHSSCVGPWLTKWGTFCPVCKHDMRTKLGCLEVKRRIRP